MIDLSHPLENGMPVYPGTEPPALVDVAAIDPDGFREKRLAICSHTGTHVDAPAHILPGAATLDQLPVAHFFGRALLLDCTHKGGAGVSLANLLAHEADIRAHEFVILPTGWSRYWGEPLYFQGYPVLAADAARWLAGQGLKGLGLDAISVDPVDAVDLTVHTLLLKAGMVIVENLTHLSALPRPSFHFCCLPLNIRDADGSPVRAVAMLP